MDNAYWTIPDVVLVPLPAFPVFQPLPYKYVFSASAFVQLIQVNTPCSSVAEVSLNHCPLQYSPRTAAGEVTIGKGSLVPASSVLSSGLCSHQGLKWGEGSLNKRRFRCCIIIEAEDDEGLLHPCTWVSLCFYKIICRVEP